uniref:Uncharacterized protein n=1 Tax=Rhinopithecus roxellana TaxID=61622 RepID=A0A2K6PHC4_RHIRO
VVGEGTRDTPGSSSRSKTSCGIKGRSRKVLEEDWRRTTDPMMHMEMGVNLHHLLWDMCMCKRTIIS